MFGWLNKKFSRQQEEDARVFLNGLRGAPDAELELIHATAIYYASAQGLDFYDLANWIHGRPHLPVDLNKAVKTYQRARQPQFALGPMVWLHTARAALYPELKLGGCHIWQVLMKSGPKTESLAILLALEHNGNPEVCKMRYPDQFEPTAWNELAP